MYASQIDNIRTLQSIANENLENNYTYKLNTKWITDLDETNNELKSKIKELKKRDKKELMYPDRNWDKTTVGDEIENLENRI